LSASVDSAAKQCDMLVITHIKHVGRKSALGQLSLAMPPNAGK